MGYHSSKALSFLMTVFNVRLGWWCGNPKFPDQWKKAGTPWGIWYLMAELFGKTNEKLKYVYLSDGGHFENLGIYELVRRRCRFIVACDASQDPDKRFEDLGNAIRKVRVDLGVSIDINVSHLKGKSSDKKCCAVGTIHYKKDDGSAAEEGKLIYIKPTLCGNEPVDILNYAKTHTSFPHQSTGDQWFDEVQFESYRMLGYHSVFEICGKDWQGKTFDDFLSCAQKYAEEGDSRQ
jgi:hypothetical protein